MWYGTAADAVGQRKLHYLVFDLLACDSENVMNKPLSTRYEVSLSGGRKDIICVDATPNEDTRMLGHEPIPLADQ